MLYDLSLDVEVNVALRARAEQWVRSSAFKQVADPDVALAGALRYATSCGERHDLLPTAGEKGGERVLAFLKIAKVPAGCGRSASKDCFPCLRHDEALNDAIAAIDCFNRSDHRRCDALFVEVELAPAAFDAAGVKQDTGGMHDGIHGREAGFEHVSIGNRAGEEPLYFGQNLARL